MSNESSNTVIYCVKFHNWLLFGNYGIAYYFILFSRYVYQNKQLLTIKGYEIEVLFESHLN